MLSPLLRSVYCLSAFCLLLSAFCLLPFAHCLMLHSAHDRGPARRKSFKQYRIYERPGDRLKESLSRGLLRRHKEFWALRDVEFEIEAGTTVGIIGPNGCGKSTLLQIISGTLAPTHGDVWHEGRIAALLELGAGFDPEFTGVENVYMNAGLLGLTRRETDAPLPRYRALRRNRSIPLPAGQNLFERHVRPAGFRNRRER